MGMGERIEVRKEWLWLVVCLLGPSPMLAQNHQPQAMDDRVTVRQESFVDIDALANDRDPDGDFLVITGVSPSSGELYSLSIVDESLIRFFGCAFEPITFDYWVEDDHGGTDSAQVTVVPAVEGQCLGNVVPVCFADFATTPPGIPVDMAVLENDSHALSVSRVGEAAHGTATVLTNNLIRFQPTVGFVGDAGYRYWALGSGGEVESSAWATVHVTEDPPGNERDDFRTERDKILPLSEQDLLGDDGDPGARLTGVYVPVGSPGQVELVEPLEGRPWVLYTPPSGAVGEFEFTYQAVNGSGNVYEAIVTVLVVSPVGNLAAADDYAHTVPGGCLTFPFSGLLDNDDAGPAGEVLLKSETVVETLVGSLTVNGSADTLTYSPNAGYVGKDFFRYEARFSNDGEGEEGNWATVVIDIGQAPQHRAPMAFADWSEIDTSLTNTIYIPVLNNDSSATCDELTLESVPGSTPKATLSIVGDTVKYTVPPTSSGRDEFQYVVSSADGQVSTGTVRVDIFYQDRAPWPRVRYLQSCEIAAECVVDGTESRHGYSPHDNWNFLGTPGPYVGDRCGYYWYVEGVTSPPPENNNCNPPLQGEDFHLDSYFTEPGLVPVALKLWDRGLTATRRLLFPFGATMESWDVEVDCQENTCTFTPLGTLVEGVVEKFLWYFDGEVEIVDPCAPFGCDGDYPVNWDAETFDLTPVTHTYVGAAPGDPIEVELLTFLFDRRQWVSKVVAFAIPVPPPLAPVGLTTDNQNCAASGPLLLWGDVSSDEDGFRVYRSVNGAGWALLENGELEADETELQDHYDGPRTHQLRYRVAAFNAGGESLSGEAVGFPAPADCDNAGSVPIAPSHLVAAAPAEGVHLSWRDNTSQEVGYRLYRGENGAALELLAVLGTNATSYYDAPLTPGSTYTYRVRAVNTHGESPGANAQVNVPVGLFVDSFERGDTSGWERTVGSRRLFFDGFESADTSGWERVVQDGRLFYDSFETGDASGWERAVNMNGLFKDSFESGDTLGWERSIGVWGAPTGLPVLAPDASLSASRAESLSPEARAMRRRDDRLLRPSGLQVASFERGGVRLAWRDRSTTEDSFELFRKEKGGQWERVAVLAKNITEAWDGPLSVGKSYRYRVAAVGVPGDGTGSGSLKRRKSLVLKVRVPKEVFADSFEVRDFRAWNVQEDLSAQLKLRSAGALFGNRGLVVDLELGSGAYLETDAPEAETQMRGRFLIDPHQVELPAGLGEGQRVATLLEALGEAGSDRVFALEWVQSAAGPGPGSGSGLRGVTWNTSGQRYATSILPLGTQPSRIEFRWVAASSGNGRGRLRLWVDDLPKVAVGGWDGLGLTVGRLRFGAMNLVPGSGGDLFLDEVVLTRGGGRVRHQALAGHLGSESFEFASIPNWKTFVGGAARVELSAGTLEGEQALAVVLEEEGDQGYVERSLFRSQDHLLLNLMVDAQDLNLASGGEVQVFSAATRQPDSPVLFEVLLRRQVSTTSVVVRGQDGEEFQESSVPLPAGAFLLEVEWRSSERRTDRGGSLHLRLRDLDHEPLDGVLLEGLRTGSGRVSLLRLGSAEAVPAGVSGVLRLDQFEGWR
ncbi:MAG: hypothetical protein K0U98_24775 [Deltaproteobacteria bacterium]|nr:hypothetical protein [Deltaproteobacteria bacterium]